MSLRSGPVPAPHLAEVTQPEIFFLIGIFFVIPFNFFDWIFFFSCVTWRRWARSDPQALATLLLRHQGSDICCRQLGQRPDSWCQRRVGEDIARSTTAGCLSFGACKQARSAGCHACEGNHGEARAAKASRSEVVHSVHSGPHRRWALWGLGLAFAKYFWLIYEAATVQDSASPTLILLGLCEAYAALRQVRRACRMPPLGRGLTVQNRLDLVTFVLHGTQKENNRSDWEVSSLRSDCCQWLGLCWPRLLLLHADAAAPSQFSRRGGVKSWNI